ncbi:glycosyltransferase WbuB, partial [Bradyrhizobium sp. SHOUNA76]|nr:glycosyltransferase WbuB [Bradyrhizobium sp. SHOUNA76]
MDRGARAGDRARRPRDNQDYPQGCGARIRVDRGLTMQPSGKIVVASQHYPPDTSTTAAIMAEIACRLAAGHEVVVLSG